MLWHNTTLTSYLPLNSIQTSVQLTLTLFIFHTCCLYFEHRDLNHVHSQQLDVEGTKMELTKIRINFKDFQLP